MRRVVGASLVSACEDIYAEVRALHEIHRDYAADTDELIRRSATMPRATASQPAGLVQLELKSLVSQLRERAARLREAQAPDETRDTEWDPFQWNISGAIGRDAAQRALRPARPSRSPLG